MTPGNAWIWTEQSRKWREIDASTEVVRQVRWPEAGMPWDHGAGTPELATARGGGVYRLQGGEEWLLISPGVPLAGNDTSALIQVCESPTLCESSLIDLEMGQAVDRWLPPSLEDSAGRRYRISPSGANILEMSPTNRSWEAVFVYSDGVVRSTACMQGWRDAAWSEDETLLACTTDRGVTVTDLVRGTAATFGDLGEEPFGVVLVKSAAVGIGR